MPISADAWNQDRIWRHCSYERGFSGHQRDWVLVNDCAQSCPQHRRYSQGVWQNYPLRPQNVRRSWPISVLERGLCNFGECRPTFAQIGPHPVEIARLRVEYGRDGVEIDRIHVPKPRTNSNDIGHFRPGSTNLGPMSADLKLKSAKLGQIRLAQSRPNSPGISPETIRFGTTAGNICVASGTTSAGIGQTWPGIGQNSSGIVWPWPGDGQSRPEWDRVWPDVGQLWAHGEAERS